MQTAVVSRHALPGEGATIGCGHGRCERAPGMKHGSTAERWQAAEETSLTKGRTATPIIAVVMLLAAAAQASPLGSGWKLLFADEFAGSSIDGVKWDTKYSWGRTHNHDAYMLDDNVTVDAGNVTLNATRESTSGKAFNSGVISSHNTFRYTYGYAEMKIKMPSKRGSWPAFWMLNTGWPPEIDIMEYPLFTGNSTTDRYAINSFWGSCCNPPSNFSWIDTNTNLGNDFHTYGLEWNSNQLKYYFDGQLVKTASNQAQFQNMYTIFNYAEGGWPGSPSQAQWADGASDATRAEWFRVWQKESAPDTTWTYAASASGSWTDDANWDTDSPKWGQQKAYLPTLAGQPAMQLNWNDSKTVGELHFTGDTAYTVGDSASDSLMFANNSDGWGRIRVLSGSGGHAINSRVDLWSNLSAKNDVGTFTFNGDIIDQLRQNSGGVYSGGILKLWGAGAFVINGDGYYRRATLVQSGVTVTLNGKLYQDAQPLPDAAETYLDVSGGSALSLADLNEGGSLGNLPADSDRIILDDGKLILRGVTHTSRGFTIGAGSATLDASLFSSVTLNDDGVPEHAIVANGGDLTLQGFEAAALNKVLGGTGGLIKAGDNVWTLGGANTYAGTTTVAGGKLNLTGTTGAGDATINNGAELTGGGAVLGNLVVASGATVEPGGDRTVFSGPFSPAFQYELIVDGDYTQQANATLKVELLSSSVFDRMVVAGSAAIAGGLALEQDYAVALGDAFTVLSANTLSGRFDQPQITGATIDADSAIAVLYETDAVRLLATYRGDTNGDGTVSLIDLNALGANFSQAGTWRSGDFNYDGQVTLADLNALGANFGATVPAASTVPEPASAVLLALGAAALQRKGRNAA